MKKNSVRHSDGKDVAMKDQPDTPATQSSTSLSREAFLAAPDRPPVPVPLDEALYGPGACVFLRIMSGTERSEYEKKWAGKDAGKNPGTFRWDLLVRTIVDERGEPLFGAEDEAAVMAKNAGTLEMLFEESGKLNGLRRKDVEDLEKNSQTGPESGSSSDSAPLA